MRMKKAWEAATKRASAVLDNAAESDEGSSDEGLPETVTTRGRGRGRGHGRGRAAQSKKKLRASSLGHELGEEGSPEAVSSRGRGRGRGCLAELKKTSPAESEERGVSQNTNTSQGT